MSEASWSDQDRSLGFLRARFKRDKTYYIELERYNEIRELIIENRTTGFQGHVCHQDRGERVSVTMAAVCMGVKEMGMQTGHRGAYNQTPSQE